MIDINELKFDEKGLIPAIVVDSVTKRVLTLAYMNRESLDITLAEGYTCFYSRSRKCLWRKGETSGNRQKVVSITADCDCDALTVKVDKEGPACHTGAESCFFNSLFSSGEEQEFSLESLYELIMGRKTEGKEGSYTTYLFQKGKEISDLAYHVLVLMAEMGISVQDIKDELASRHVVDKKVKQETMK